jgi:hypothetical protein
LIASVARILPKVHRRVQKPEIDIGRSCSFSSRARRVVIPRGSRHKTAARGLDPAHRYFET